MFQKLCFMVQVAQLSASTDHKFMAQWFGMKMYYPRKLSNVL
jgi:hypothetical protein